MFSGIIQSLGKIVSVQENSAKIPCGFRFVLEVPYGYVIPSQKASLGESIAVDGVCLTAVKRKRKKNRLLLTLDVASETARKTTLPKLVPGKKVNIEWPLKIGDPLGGHFVQGHVDATGKILQIEPQGNSKLYWFSVPAFLQPYLVPKGSIAVDGISLTIVEVGRGRFSVAILPFTEANTSLRAKKIGDEVNLEADILIKSVMSCVSWVMSLKSKKQDSERTTQEDVVG